MAYVTQESDFTPGVDLIIHDLFSPYRGITKYTKEYNLIVRDNRALTLKKKNTVDKYIKQILECCWYQKKCIYKWKLFINNKKKVVNEYDLLGSSIKDIPSNEKIKIKHLNSIYEFTLFDIYKIFTSSLLHSDNKIPCPQRPRNPYTNIDFPWIHTLVLYNFLIKVMCEKYKKGLPSYITIYKEVDFDINAFSLNNNTYLYQHSIEKHYDNIDIENLYKESKCLLNKYKLYKYVCERCLWKELQYNYELINSLKSQLKNFYNLQDHQSILIQRPKIIKFFLNNIINTNTKIQKKTHHHDPRLKGKRKYKYVIRR